MDWQVKGSRLVKKDSEYYFHVTFRKTVKERKAEGVLGIDINERSRDLALIKQDKVRFIRIDVSEIKCIRDRYFRKRRNIQTKAPKKVRIKLLAKYSGREKEKSE